jgi:hypothetical protein
MMASVVVLGLESPPLANQRDRHRPVPDAHDVGSARPDAPRSPAAQLARFADALEDQNVVIGVRLDRTRCSGGPSLRISIEQSHQASRSGGRQLHYLVFLLVPGNQFLNTQSNHLVFEGIAVSEAEQSAGRPVGVDHSLNLLWRMVPGREGIGLGHRYTPQPRLTAEASSLSGRKGTSGTVGGGAAQSESH